MSNLEKAIEIALEVHHKQLDKAGQPYILHPLRIMIKQNDETGRIVAVLHDVVEDSIWTLRDLKYAGFSDEIIDAVDCLTHKKTKSEDYFSYINRVKTNSIARKVKIADLEDNMDMKRLPDITDKDLKRLKKYHKALNILFEK